MNDSTGPDAMRSLIAGHTPQEAAALLNHLESGCQAAWQAQHEARFTREGQARFATAAELDAIRVDAWWATVENGMRHPGEPLADFTERPTASPARTPDARRATAISTDPTTPSSAVFVQPATEWMKGARTAHDVIARQVEAGYSADRIAERWDQALAAYDGTTATPTEREWHAGAEETARDMIQTWRDIQAAEAGQALAPRAEPQAAPELEAEAG